MASISLDRQNEFASPYFTSNLLKKLSDSTTEPLQIYLWSCNSGAAKKDINILPEGSVLITSSDEDASTYGIDQFFLNKISHPSPYLSFLNFLTTKLIMSLTNKFAFTTSLNQKTYSFSATRVYDDNFQTKYEYAAEFMKFYFKLSSEHGYRSSYLDTQDDVHKIMTKFYLSAIKFPSDLTCTSDVLPKSVRYLKDNYENINNIFDSVTVDMLPVCYTENLSEETKSISSVLKEGAEAGLDGLLVSGAPSDSLENYEL